MFDCFRSDLKPTSEYISSNSFVTDQAKPPLQIDARTLFQEVCHGWLYLKTLVFFSFQTVVIGKFTKVAVGLGADGKNVFFLCVDTSPESHCLHLVQAYKMAEIVDVVEHVCIFSFGSILVQMRACWAWNPIQ